LRTAKKKSVSKVLGADRTTSLLAQELALVSRLSKHGDVLVPQETSVPLLALVWLLPTRDAGAVTALVIEMSPERNVLAKTTALPCSAERIAVTRLPVVIRGETADLLAMVVTDPLATLVTDLLVMVVIDPLATLVTDLPATVVIDPLVTSVTDLLVATSVIDPLATAIDLLVTLVTDLLVETLGATIDLLVMAVTDLLATLVTDLLVTVVIDLLATLETVLLVTVAIDPLVTLETDHLAVALAVAVAVAVTTGDALAIMPLVRMLLAEMPPRTLAMMEAGLRSRSVKQPRLLNRTSCKCKFGCLSIFE
jgi:hypothetical protein